MDNLPTDIIDNILSRLPVESRLQNRRVSKSWKNLIGDRKKGLLLSYANLIDNVWDTKIDLYYGDDLDNLEQFYSTEALTKLDSATYSLCTLSGHSIWNKYHHHMVGSCNGLVCLHLNTQVTNARCGAICNPVTGEFLLLPGLTKPSSLRDWGIIGFGYVPSTREHKVVRCSYRLLEGEQNGLLEVYTLGSQTGWRVKEKIPHKFYSATLFVNGAIHWIGKIIQGGHEVYKVVAYDLAEEKVKYVSSLPFEYFKGYDPTTGRLELLGGHLCAVKYNDHRDEIKVWAFKERNIENNTRIMGHRATDYYDHKWSWSNEFSISVRDPEMYRPYAITESNGVLLWHKQNKVYCYDRNALTLTMLWEGDGKGSSCLQAIPHTNTLVSLKDLGECCAYNVSSDNGENSGSKKSKQRKRRKC
ncbi:F-box protein At3g07870-like [Papaver somniferum]|uniref:F-box protein At3g07870-like n=1 Tax=Papaver somniferum TaxID=3469 RepID=UPI000E703FCA|nr:F-box protein At3g07870-like [Papaver somniferum]XP_026389807.1 F-box protein At3g07870-like [Papaver somniferum]XP_026389808.1 F-box protein At3g07870-like [Papaver somniferum]XP_026389810.1 F-box protein At3g07870-like [Papaver somniferum]XP_026389811.1 F-box protein At3g07870-like [Papaver somniferum]